MGNLNSDTNRVYFYINLRLKSDIDVAEQWIKYRSAKYVFELKEEKGISFEWFLSDDNTEATLIESYVDSDGAKQRIENHAKILLYEKTQRLVKQMRQINEHYESIGKKPDFL